MQYSIIVYESGSEHWISITCPHGESIKGLKFRLQEKTGLKPSDQTITIGGSEWPLGDDELVSQHRHFNFILNVSPDAQRFIPVFFRGTKYVVPVGFHSSFWDLKKKLCLEVDPELHELTVRGVPIEDWRFPSRFELSEEFPIHLVPLAPGKLITIRDFPAGKTFQVQPTPNQTLGELKPKLEGIIGLPKRLLTLRGQGPLPLADHVKISDVQGQICVYYPDDAKYDIFIVNNTKPGTVPEFPLKTGPGPALEFSIRVTATLGDVKEEIRSAMGIPIERQNLSCQGTLYRSNAEYLRSLDNWNRKSFSLEILKPVSVAEAGFLQKFTVYNGQTKEEYTLSCASGDTIHALKRQLESKIGIHAKNISFMCDGQTLCDDTPSYVPVGRITFSYDRDSKCDVIVGDRTDPRNAVEFIATVTLESTISDLAAVSSRIIGHPVDAQQFSFGGKACPANAKIGSFNVPLRKYFVLVEKRKPHENEPTCDVVVYNKSNPALSVPFYTSAQIGSSIADLKASISKQQGYPIGNQLIFFNDVLCSDDSTISTQRRVFSLKVTSHKTHPDQTIGVSVKRTIQDRFDQNGEPFTMDVEFPAQATVRMLKSLILEKTGYPIEEQLLTSNGKELSDGDQAKSTAQNMVIVLTKSMPRLVPAPVGYPRPRLREEGSPGLIPHNPIVVPTDIHQVGSGAHLPERDRCASPDQTLEVKRDARSHPIIKQWLDIHNKNPVPRESETLSLLRQIGSLVDAAATKHEKEIVEMRERADDSGHRYVDLETELSSVRCELRMTKEQSNALNETMKKELDSSKRKVKKLRKKLKAASEEKEKECSICMEDPPNIAFIPCGHMHVCARCAPQFKLCPHCSQAITGTLKVFAD